ncbi:MAG: pantoate--beta-alanine ligase [Nitrospiraceae bacterium]|nr:pantoate--beta-alanine ligase [Nitrospiraceae bacterium]MSR24169.1 pantoate--beta-alanine ligase [Nitrospiraceae bacterium]
MQTIRTAKAMMAWSSAHHREGVTIGIVPTMGALHAGHRALIRAARLSCDAVVVSLFVNPAQFGPKEDFSRYPRKLKADTALCAKEGVDVLFAPPVGEIYPDGFQTTVSTVKLAHRWEGERRPGHFDGVATVVTKLLTLVRPTAAFFGQKDFQQAVLVKRLVEDLNLGARVIVSPTVREADGLALSSRNVFLTPGQRRAATVLFQALKAGRAAIRAGGRSGANIQQVMRKTLVAEPLASLDYLAVCDPDTLEPLAQIRDRAVLLGAIRIGEIRLIDNLLVTC